MLTHGVVVAVDLYVHGSSDNFTILILGDSISFLILNEVIKYWFSHSHSTLVMSKIDYCTIIITVVIS